MLKALLISFGLLFQPPITQTEEPTYYTCQQMNTTIFCQATESYNPGDTNRPKLISVERAAFLGHLTFIAIKIDMENENNSKMISILLNGYLNYIISTIDAKTCVALAASKEEAIVCLINTFRFGTGT